MMKLGEPKEEGMSSPAPPKRKNSGRTRRRGISKILRSACVVVRSTRGPPYQSTRRKAPFRPW